MDLPDVNTALQTILGTEYSIVSGTVNARSDFDPYGGYYIASPQYTLEIVIYYDQKALGQNLDLFSITEEKVGHLIYEIGGNFVQRRVEPFREQFVCRTFHEIRIVDIVEFYTKLETYAKKVSDAEFAKALEVKLSED